MVQILCLAVLLQQAAGLVDDTQVLMGRLAVRAAARHITKLLVLEHQVKATTGALAV
jgi:hypothetical protein